MTKKEWIILLWAVILLGGVMGAMFVPVLLYQEKEEALASPLPNSPIKELRPGASGRLYVLLENGEIWRKVSEGKWKRE